MSDSTIYLIILFACGTWMITFPNHLMFMMSKYQLFMFRYIPIFPFKSEREAEVSIFNKKSVRALGYANYFIAVVIATKIQW
jgi:hypothetical protein